MTGCHTGYHPLRCESENVTESEPIEARLFFLYQIAVYRCNLETLALPVSPTPEAAFKPKRGCPIIFLFFWSPKSKAVHIVGHNTWGVQELGAPLIGAPDANSLEFLTRAYKDIKRPNPYEGVAGFLMGIMSFTIGVQASKERRATLGRPAQVLPLKNFARIKRSSCNLSRKAGRRLYRVFTRPVTSDSLTYRLVDRPL
ncbi:hypothetical protein LX36DRAFT_500254 [Colletotrichum falcatum]|nr:hypothetical protein LX36DRAFT_500254 [Colletotrichum falcatum]